MIAAGTPTVSALPQLPDFARGYVKDLRVRWALEEAGLLYRIELVEGHARQGAAYRRWQPFGQVPAFREGAVEMFDSGAIVLHLAARSERLAPPDSAGAARVASWVLAAVTTVQPHVDIANHLAPHLPDEVRARWHALLLDRMRALDTWLDGKEWLEARFTAGDLVMATVIREVAAETLQGLPSVSSWLARCLGRPAFQAALAAQLDDLGA